MKNVHKFANIFLLVSTIVTALSKVDDISATMSDQTMNLNTCISYDCLSMAAILIESIDTTVDPCENFFDFVCGKFMDNARIPDNAVKHDAISQDQKHLNTYAYNLLQRIEGDRFDRHAFKLLKDLHATCVRNMNFTDISNRSLMHIDNIFNSIGGWPVLFSEWNDHLFDWKNATNLLNSKGFTVYDLMKISVELNPKNTSQFTFMIDQLVLEYPRELYLNRESHFMNAYYEYMVDVAEIFGAQRNETMEQLQECLEFERHLALISSPNGDSEKIYIFKVKNIAKYIPEIISVEYVNNMLNTGRNVTENDFISVKNLDYLSDLGHLLKGTSPRIIANYIGWKLISNSAHFLSNEIRNRQFLFHQAVTGQVDQKEHWDACIEMLKIYLPESFQVFYTTKPLCSETAAFVGDMFKNIKVQFERTLFKIRWIEIDKIHELLRKVWSLQLDISCPVAEVYEHELDEFYKDLDIVEDDLLLSMLRINLFYKNKLLGLYMNKKNSTGWFNHKYCSYNNAFYFNDINTIEMPSYILHGIYFSANRPNYINYGLLGTILGHELLHSFDDIHPLKMKSTIFNRDSWNISECFIDKYSRFYIKELKEFGNGYSTLFENVADNGGVKLAYYAYQTYFKDNEEKHLPGLNYTLNQLFWMSYGSFHCRKYRAEAFKHIVKIYPHAVPEFRVNGVLSNIKEFVKDFNCPLGSNMNPEKKCSMW